MILNVQYKTYARQIANVFCKTDVLCSESVYQRILNYFTNATFEHFLQNISTGRYYILKYSNWHTGNTCRDMLIDVRLTDVVTGTVQTGYWNYTNQNCDDKKFYYPDLNSLINKFHYTLLDAPIMNKNNSEITKERLVWNRNANSYGITFVPPTGGGGGGQITPTPNQPIEPILNTPVSKEAGFNLESITSNPYLLGGALAVLFFYFMKK
jgi:hypothetical protein